jgi:hypothetical protein
MHGAKNNFENYNQREKGVTLEPEGLQKANLYQNVKKL